MNFSSDSSGKEPALRGSGSIPGSGRSPGGGYGNPLQHSYLENPTDKGSWWATVHGVAKSRTRLRRLCMHTIISTSSLTFLFPVSLKRHWCLNHKANPLSMLPYRCSMSCLHTPSKVITFLIWRLWKRTCILATYNFTFRTSLCTVLKAITMREINESPDQGRNLDTNTGWPVVNC